MNIPEKAKNLNRNGSKTPKEPAPGMMTKQPVSGVATESVGRFTKYAEAGFLEQVMPIIPPKAELHKLSKLDANHLGKIPGIRKPNGTWVGRYGWTKEKTTHRSIRTWDKWEGAGACIRTGVVVGVDIDVTDEPLSLAIEAEALKILGPTPSRIGNAPKRLMPYRTTKPSSKEKDDFTHLETGETHAVEILGTGQQFVAEGIHPKTKQPYRWERGDLIELGFEGLTEVTPEQVDEFLNAVSDLMAEAGYRKSEMAKALRGSSKPRTPIGDPSMIGDPELVRTALALIGNEFDYDKWIRFAAAIKAALGGDMAHYQIYEDWCLLYPGNDGDIAREKWNSFTDTEVGFEYLIETAKKIAREQGDLDFIQACTEYDTQLASNLAKVLMSAEDEDTAPEEVAAVAEVKIEAILKPPGLVGDIAAYHNQTSLRETPIFGVAAGLASVSALAANNFAFMPEVGHPTSTNLFLMTVGATGVGKEHPRSVVKEALRAADATHMDVDAASEPALFRHLAENRNGVWMKDEIGRHLEFAANPNGGHQYSLITGLMSLYGLPFSSTARRVYADGKNTISPVANPYMTIFSTSTRESLAKALNSSAVVDGTLNRFVVIHNPDNQPRFQDKIWSRMDEELKRKIKHVSHTGNVASLAKVLSDADADTNPPEMVEIRGRQFIPIKPEPGVMDLLLSFRSEADDKRAEGGLVAPLWARAYENALRVAGVVTLGASDPKQPVMTIEHAQWAITFIRWAMENSISLMDNVSDNEVERFSKAIEKFAHEVIKNPDKKFDKHNRDGHVPKSQITRRFRTLRGSEIDQHLKTLCDAGIMEQVDIGTGGRSVKAYKPCGK
jgi:hypothetical protein